MYDLERTATYDYAKPWVTHQCVQHWEPAFVSTWLRNCPKPVVLDEMCYEGNAPRRWGNISGEELVRRYWECMMRGGFAAHGEVFERRSDWISRGGALAGDSPPRIAFLRDLMEESRPDLWRPYEDRQFIWHYMGVSRPARWRVELPGSYAYRIDVVDTWDMRMERKDGEFRGFCEVELPGKSYMAIRMARIEP
jgi:hypothetical protein